MNKENTPNYTDPTQFKLDDRQDLIYERLSRLVSPGIAELFKDACRHMILRPPFAATTNIVAHLLREIESALHDVLEPVIGESGKPKVELCKKCGQEIKASSHSDKIKVVVKALNLSDKVAEAWLGLPGKKGLQKLAHRAGLKPVRSVDKEFKQFWSSMQIVLHTALDSFESQYVKIFHKLDELASKANPTKKDASFFCSNIPNNYIAHAHFFNQLDNPAWLSLLKGRGVFKEAPKPESGTAEDGSISIRYPLWPIAVYLEKMALVKPGLVVEILLRIKETSNVNVKSNLLTIATNLPADKRLLIVKKAKNWMDDMHRFYAYEPSRKFIQKLVEDKQADLALGFVKIILEILPDPKSKTPPTNGPYVPDYNPKGKIDAWQYGDFLKKDLQSFIEFDAKKIFNLLCQLLLDFMNLKHLHRKSHGYEDYSYISRPAIEDHEQNRGLDRIEDLLINAIRDIAIYIIKKDPSSIKELVASLEKRKWTIFYRISLYLLSEFPESDKTLVTEHLTNRSFLNKSNIKHEYARLMNKGFRLLSSEQQGLILNWVEQAEKINERIKKSKDPISKQKALKIKEVWQRDQLSHIKDDLEGSWKIRYKELVSKHGEPEHPDFSAYMSSWVGPTSNVSSKEIIAMDEEAIVELLKTWQPESKQHDFGPTKEGLGRELIAAIKLEPKRFDRIAEKFKDLDPTYVRSYIQAFHDLVQNGYELDWRKMFELCFWAVEQPREIPGRKGEFMDQDPSWGWTRKAIVSLISKGMNNNSIPYDLREKAWKIINSLTHDPDPTPSDESDRGEGTNDAYSLAINTCRGEAMNAVVEYAL